MTFHFKGRNASKVSSVLTNQPLLVLYITNVLSTIVQLQLARIEN